MAEEVESLESKVSQREGIGKVVLAPLNHAIAAGAREALKLGVPAHQVCEMLLNDLASVVAMIEPAGVRAELIQGVTASFANLVRQHVEVRHTTPGGIITPRPIDEVVGHG